MEGIRRLNTYWAIALFGLPAVFGIGAVIAFLFTSYSVTMFIILALVITIAAVIGCIHWEFPPVAMSITLAVVVAIEVVIGHANWWLFTDHPIAMFITLAVVVAVAMIGCVLWTREYIWHGISAGTHKEYWNMRMWHGLVVVTWAVTLWWAIALPIVWWVGQQQVYGGRVFDVIIWTIQSIILILQHGGFGGITIR